MFKDIPYLEETKPAAGDGWYLCPAEKIAEACKALRDEHKFNCLSCLTGTDRGDHIEVVYHLFSYETKEAVVLKVRVIAPVRQSFGGSEAKQPPELNCSQEIASSVTGGLAMTGIPSVSDIYPSANWMERETFDLLGVNFTGHPDLRRILLPEDWDGHPLRKDYKEKEEYCGMSTIRTPLLCKEG